jgi:uncharacterized protein YfdQ (DUF2303 family)
VSYEKPKFEVDSSFGSALAAGAALGTPQSPSVEAGAGVYTVVPKDYAVTNLEKYLPRPLRIRQKVELHDAESFLDYVNQYAVPNVSRIFFDGEQETFTGILDYHEQPGTPAWCGHVAVYTARRSVEFTTWMNQNRKQMSQVEFARFLEENMPDVVEPASAELLQVALTFEAKKSVEFASGVRLNNGQIQFQFTEVIRGAAQNGTIEIPEQFVLGVPIHFHGPAYRIPVRLRWRLQEGKVIFWYEIVRPHKFIEDALKEIRERISEKTALALLAGSAAQ